MAGGLWVTLSKIVTFLLTFGGGIILARFLEPKLFGAVAMATAVSVIFSRLCNIGVRPEIMRLDADRPDYHDCVSTIFWVNAIVTAGAVVLASLIVYAIPVLSENAKKVFPVIMFCWAGDNLSLPARSLLHKHMRYWELFWIRVMVPLLSMPVAIGMVLSGLGIWSLVIPQSGFLLLSGVIAYILVCHPLVFRLSGEAIKLISCQGGWYVTHGLTAAGYTKADNLVIGTFLGDTALGLYSRAYSLGALFHQQAGTVLYTLGLPVYTDPSLPEVTKMAYLRLAIKAIVYGVFPVVLFVALYINPLIQFVYGDKWLPAGQYFQYLAPFAVLWPVYQLFKGKLVGAGRIDYMAKLDLVKLILIVAFALILTEPYGVLGVAIAVNLSVAVAILVAGRKIYTQAPKKGEAGLMKPALFVPVMLLGLSLSDNSIFAFFPAVVFFFFYFEREEIRWLLGRAVSGRLKKKQPKSEKPLRHSNDW